VVVEYPGVLVEIETGAMFICDDGLWAGRICRAFFRLVVKMKSKRPRYRATRKEIKITIAVYMMVWNRVGHAT
jgi:hypothetical protein